MHEWNHVCASFDGATARVYLNGKLDASWPAAGTLTSAAAPLALGWKTNGADIDHLQGYLDEVRLYDHALADSDVLALYQLGLATSPVELTVACAVGSDIYLNGHATGSTCPSTLKLANAGHYWVGLDNVSKGYQQQEVFSDGKSPVALKFADANWIAPGPKRAARALRQRSSAATFAQNPF